MRPSRASLPTPVSSPPSLRAKKRTRRSPSRTPRTKLINAFERQYLVDLLDRYDGNVSKAARATDMDRKSITRLMKKHTITRDT